MNNIESTIENEIKIVGRYANLQLGVELFPNGDNSFDVCAYIYAQGEWMPLGDAEEINNSVNGHPKHHTEHLPFEIAAV